MQRIIIKGYAYKDPDYESVTLQDTCERRPFEMLFLACAIDNEPVRILTCYHGRSIPFAVRRLLNDRSVLKVCMDSRDERNSLIRAYGIGERTDSGIWLDIREFLDWMDLPEDPDEMSDFWGMGQRPNLIENDCVDYFCRPEILKGRQRYPSEDQRRWKALKRTAIWYVNLMRQILDAFPYSLEHYLRRMRADRRMVRQSLRISGWRLERYRGYYEERLCELTDEYNRVLADTGGRPSWKVLMIAVTLSNELRGDYTRLNAFRDSDILEEITDREWRKYDYPRMLYQTMELRKKKELFLLDYSGALDTAGSWLFEVNSSKRTDHGRDGKCECEYAFKRAIWMTVNHWKSCTYGRIRLQRSRRMLLIRLPSGRTLSYIYPKFRSNGGKWILEYKRFRNGEWTETSLDAGEVMKEVTAALLSDYIAALVEQIHPAGQVIASNKDSILLCLNRGRRIRFEDSLRINCEWCSTLSLKAEIYYRKDNALW